MKAQGKAVKAQGKAVKAKGRQRNFKFCSTEGATLREP